MVARRVGLFTGGWWMRNEVVNGVRDVVLCPDCGGCALRGLTAGVVTGVNAGVYGCISGRRGRLFQSGLRRGVRLH